MFYSGACLLLSCLFIPQHSSSLISIFSCEIEVIKLKEYLTQHTREDTLMYHAGSSLQKQTTITMTIAEVTAIFPLSAGRSVVRLGGQHHTILPSPQSCVCAAPIIILIQHKNTLVCIFKPITVVFGSAKNRM